MSDSQTDDLRIETSDDLDLDWNYDLIDALNEASEHAVRLTGEPAVMVMVRLLGRLSGLSIKAIAVETSDDGDDKSAMIVLEIGGAV